MGILDEDVAKVRAASDLVAVASEHIALRKVGRRYVGLCPFHAEKTASFSLNAEEGLYYCFGCQARGDVITFVREVEHLDFVGAVEALAARAGIELRYDDAATTREHQRRSRLVEAMEQAVDWYHERLLKAPDAAGARGYLRSRGYDGDVVRAYKLGWAPDEWDALARALRLPEDVLKDTGLGFVNRRGRQQDAFRARVMFPIFDVRGDPVAFGGRALASGEGPKYKNSPETPLYQKSRVLYGLNWSKAEMVSSGEVIVCEGYTDVIAFGLARLPRAVATCGTALAEEHFRVLKNFARRMVLAYDADAAGRAAAERFFEWERRYEIDLHVARIPTGTDPADVARRDPAALRAAVEQAVPFLAFRVDRAIGAGDLRSPEGRARAAEAALAVIAEHPNSLVRDQYVGQVAVRCDLPAASLARSLGRPGAAPRVVRPAPPPSRATEGPEVEALKLMVHRRREVESQLHEVLFAEELHVAVFRALTTTASLHEAIDAADPGAAALLQRLAVVEPDSEPDDVVARVAREAGARALAELVAESRRSDDPTAYAPAIGWLSLTLEQLRGDSPTRVEAASQLVPWLASRAEEQA